MGWNSLSTGDPKMRHFRTICRNEDAATSVEYSLIIGFVFLALFVGVTQFGSVAIGIWTLIAEKVIGA